MLANIVRSLRGDIRYWHGQTLLSPTSDAILAAASSVTLIIDDQKNGQCGNVIHQDATHANFSQYAQRPLALAPLRHKTPCH